MAPRRKPASPVLGAAMSIIDAASDGLVRQDSRFRHSFEAPLDRIRPDPDQPRRHFDPAEIAALAATMAAEGQLQPVLLRRDPGQRGHWIIVAGERRFRAARQNGWTSLLAIEHEGDAELAALLENLQRVDLTPAEEARGLQRLMAARGLSQAAAAGLLGRSRGEISATLRLLDLPEALLDGRLGLPRNALVELARVEPGPARERLLRLAEEGQLTVRAIRASRTEPADRAVSATPPAAAGAAPALASPPALPRLERWTEALAALPRQPLAKADRQKLLALRAAIDALLAASEA